MNNLYIYCNIFAISLWSWTCWTKEERDPRLEIQFRHNLLQYISPWYAQSPKKFHSDETRFGPIIHFSRVLLTRTIVTLLWFLVFLPWKELPIPSIVANQSNTTICTIAGTGLPRDPRWWTFRTTTVSAVEIANKKMFAPKYWAVEILQLLYLYDVPQWVVI